jgi:hypothetical protein
VGHGGDGHAFSDDPRFGDHRGFEVAALELVEDVRRVLADQLHADARMPVEHVCDQAGARIEPGGAEDAEPDGAGLQGGHGLDGAAGLVGRGESALGVPTERVGHRGGDDTPAHAAEERDTERPLQATDLLTHRRLRVAELLGGARERAVLVGGQEAAELMQREQ